MRSRNEKTKYSRWVHTCEGCTGEDWGARGSTGCKDVCKGCARSVQGCGCQDAGVQGAGAATDERTMPSSTQPEPKGMRPPSSAVSSQCCSAGWCGICRGMALVYTTSSVRGVRSPDLAPRTTRGPCSPAKRSSSSSTCKQRATEAATTRRHTPPTRRHMPPQGTHAVAVRGVRCVRHRAHRGAGHGRGCLVGPEHEVEHTEEQQEEAGEEQHLQCGGNSVLGYLLESACTHGACSTCSTYSTCSTC